MHLTEDEIALFSAFVLMSAGKKNQTKTQQFLTCSVKNVFTSTGLLTRYLIFVGLPRAAATLIQFKVSQSILPLRKHTRLFSKDLMGLKR